MISLENRSTFTENNKKEIFDLIIIGGGITGAGILLDACSRGKKCLLIEKNDYASGTSSKSTKLIHGGLRYLKNLEFKMVSDVGKERNIAFQNAPHLVRPEKMLIPLYKGKGFKKWQLSIALKIYDLLAKVRKIDRRKMLSKDETIAIEPRINSYNLIGGGLYAEYRTDDARLTTSIIKTANQYHGNSLNYMEVEKIEKKDHFEVSCFDHILNQKITFQSEHVINATGPWADQTRLLEKEKFQSKIRLSKGIHIVVPKAVLPVKHAVYYHLEDERMCFAIPRGGTTYIGTTDDDYKGSQDKINITKEEVSYLINGVNSTFTEQRIQNSDIISSWAGLRPLIEEEGKASTEISRKDEIFISKTGMITIAGGKLTGYRLMAKRAVDLIFSKEKCRTQNISIDGNFKPKFKSYYDFKQYLCLNYKINDLKSDYFIQNYGLNSISILDDFQDAKQKLICCEMKYCFEKEGVFSLSDFFYRRTGQMYFDPKSVTNDLDEVVSYYNQFISKFGIKTVSKKEILSELENQINFI